MGRFNDSNTVKVSNNSVDENQLRRPEADSDLTGSEYYKLHMDRTRVSSAYTDTKAGFHAGNHGPSSDNSSQNESHQKLSYLKAEIDFMVDGFMRELIDFESLETLSPEIQQEIINRYPQFFS